MAVDPVSAGIMAGATVAGGLMGSRAAKKAAEAQRAQAAASIEAAKIAAEEARFRPIGITTRFGTATPQLTQEGRLSGYEYAPSGELQSIQDQLARIYGPSLGQAERAAALQPQFEQAGMGLFGLGQQYVGQTPEEIRQRYMQQQRDVLRPYDIEEEQRLSAGVFGRGRGGLSVGAGGQPDLQALSESRRRRDLQLAAQADMAAQQQLGFGAGLFGQGAGVLGAGYQAQQASLAPFQTAFGLGGQAEEMAMQPMQIGAALGAKTAQFGGTAGQILQGGANTAAALNAQAQQAQAAQMAGFGAGLAGAGQNYYNMQMMKDIYNPAPRATPAPIFEDPVAPAPIPSQTINYGAGITQPGAFSPLQSS